jgi:hypothetical protein
MNDKDMERLISLYLDGVENPEEMRQLDERVRQNPEVCRELIRLATQDASIGTILEEQSFAREALARPATPAAWRMWRFLGAAAAALVVACLGVRKWASSPHGASRELTGIVAETRGHVARQPEDARLKVGDVLRPGDAVHTGPDGYLKYAYRDGTVMAVEANSDFALLEGAKSSAKSVRLAKGVLTANVRPQLERQGMLLTTPHAVATVKGTVLRLRVTPEYSELNVQTGKVEFATATTRACVASSESATVQDGKLCKFMGQGPVAQAADVHGDGKILFQDAFEGGFTSWTLYTKVGAGKGIQTTPEQCPDIRIDRVARDGAVKPVAALTGTAPGGKRVGILMKQAVAAEGASLSYDYTYEGRPRLAMEGIEIDRFCPPSATSLGDKIAAKARGPGQWNTVRWEITPQTDTEGNRYADVKLLFNGECIGRRCEYSDIAAASPLRFQLVLEVVEGQLFFDNVVIRELIKTGDHRQ